MTSNDVLSGASLEWGLTRPDCSSQRSLTPPTPWTLTRASLDYRKLRSRGEARPARRLLERYLATHRGTLQDEQCLSAVREVLDVFVAAGWASAQPLAHRLAEIFR